MNRRTLTLCLALSACDATPIGDAGVDAPRRDAPDGGFVPGSIAPCTLDPSMGFDGAPLAAYPWLTASPTARRLAYPLVVLADDGSVDAIPTSALRRAELDLAADCAGEAGCVRGHLAFDAAAAAAAASETVEALTAAGTLTDVASELRGAGVCALIDAADEGAFVSACIERVLGELSAGLDVLGEAPATELDALIDRLAMDETLPFHAPILSALEEGLVLADRPEPIRYEPKDDENRAAIDAARTTDWDAFDFTVIVVPGQGPTDPDTALNPAGRARADLAYDRWAAGVAPFVLLTGGHVHPDRTRFSEAIEMRRHLMEVRGMPASAIFVDPYARHTTTNLRNATRVLARAGVPMDRRMLITTDRIQSIYVMDTSFWARCDEELGYRPFAALERVSDFDVCMIPSITSLHVAPSDPLDP